MATGKLIEALFLDFDGTMIDSERHLYVLYDELLASYGEKGSKEEFAFLTGATLSEICTYLAKKIPLSEEECKNRYHSTLLTLYKEKMTPFEGLEEALLRFQKMGLKLFIVTSCFKEYVDAFLSSHQVINRLIDGIQTPDKGIKGKPHPDLYLKALEKFSCDPDTTWVVEDSVNGMAAAKSAKLHTLAFTWEKGWKEILEKVEKG